MVTESPVSMSPVSQDVMRPPFTNLHTYTHIPRVRKERGGIVGRVKKGGKKRNRREGDGREGDGEVRSERE